MNSALFSKIAQKTITAKASPKTQHHHGDGAFENPAVDEIRDVEIRESVGDIGWLTLYNPVTKAERHNH